MNNHELEFLKACIDYINEKLYRLEIELEPDTRQRETVMGLRALTSTVINLVEDK